MFEVVAADAVAAGLAHRAARRAGDQHGEPEPPYPRIEPDFADWRERAQWMIGLGQRLQARGAVPSATGTRVARDRSS